MKWVLRERNIQFPAWKQYVSVHYGAAFTTERQSKAERFPSKEAALQFRDDNWLRDSFTPVKLIKRGSRRA